jgi:hypothetical protein
LLRLFRTGVDDGFEPGSSGEAFEAFGEIVGADEGSQVFAELVVRLVVEGADGGFLDGSVHPLGLSVSSRMRKLCEPVIDVVLRACVFKGMGAEELAGGDSVLDFDGAQTISLGIGEMCSVVGEDGVDLAGDSGDEPTQKVTGDPAGRCLV